MRSLIVKTTVICLLASAIALFCIHDSQKTAKAVVTYWHKIPPNTCIIKSVGDDLSIADNGDAYGYLRIGQNVTGPVAMEAYCPVNLPHGVVGKTLRIRDFQTGGLPAYTKVTAALKRLSWYNSGTTLATAIIDESSDTDDDAIFSSTINNESYQYLVHVTLTKYYSATVSPEISMIEIKYEQ